MFPFTLNGNVWTKPQFQGTALARNLGPFLYDLLHQKLSIIELSPASFNSGGASVNVLTVPAGLRFQKGTMVLVSSSVYPYSRVHAKVTAYTGTSMTLQNYSHEELVVFAPTWTSITIVPEGVFDPAYTTEGYLDPVGAPTATLTAMGLPPLSLAWGEIFEDFRGHKPIASAGSYTPASGGTYVSYDSTGEAQNKKWGVVCYGSGTGRALGALGGVFPGDAVQLPLPLVMPHRVGFMELSVTRANDVAALVLNGVKVPVDSELRFKIAFMLPVLPGASPKSKFYVTMGMVAASSGTGTRPAQPAYQLLPPDPLVPGESYPRQGNLLVVDSAAFAAPTAYLSSTNRTVNTALATTLKAGVWYTYSATAVGNVMTVLLQGDDGSSETIAHPALASTSVSPFFSIGRPSESVGSIPIIAYIDYAYFGPRLR